MSPPAGYRNGPAQVSAYPGVHPLPAAEDQTRPRRRRFPERELLDRLRQYEDLLRQNNVKFEPLHKGPVAADKKSAETYASDNEQPEIEGPDTPTSSKPESAYEAKNLWHAMSQGSRDPNDNVREVVFRNAWDQSFDNDDHILFGSRQKSVDLSTLHPEPVHIFRLWQIYLDNVNPLLKVTHTPSLQGRIIEAASNLKNAKPTMEALMFAIYCMATLSLAADECQSIFGQTKEDLLAMFQFGCQQALLNSGFLRTGDRDCLTALYLYLHSTRSGAHPRSISSMLGVAIRIAQRMGIQTESVNARCTVLEAEMRRRLWWSLMLFDARLSGLADHKPTILGPTWDCAAPLNVSDSELREEMKDPPKVQGKVSEALFAVVRSELGDVIRHSPFHLDFTNPALKAIAKELPGGGDLDALEKFIEDKYLKFCDAQNPLHFMTMWTTRGYLSNCRLMQDYSKFLDPAVPDSEIRREAAMCNAMKWLESDTKLASSSLTKGFAWFLQLYFPFPAFIRLAQDIRAQPIGKKAEHAWEIMSDNYEARFGCKHLVHNPVFTPFTNVILQAWSAVEAASKQSGQALIMPRIVSNIKQSLTAAAQEHQQVSAEQLDPIITLDGDFLMPDLTDLGQGLFYDMMGQDAFAGANLEIY
ncbi:hypothetical protein NM208_g6725 [Fusarium decemcellulare]|uniref:Uncharacterized protein n=1 Tax=Fusarium decemcellulare TaxID=57161 RepID=A0ACC1SC76_9HYPO|nr:hypothetical protein NM208_g6725 [Fusarium decemcellulare]